MHNTIRKSGRYIYTEKLSKTQLLMSHKIKCLNISQQVLSCDNQWMKIIFSLEQKWNLDHSYWHDLKKEKEKLPKRQLDGGSVIIWRRCFACNGVGSIAFVSDNMNSQAYQRVLGSHFLSNTEFRTGENMRLQKDNAPVHASNTRKHSFLVNIVDTFKRPVKSPGLNPLMNF